MACSKFQKELYCGCLKQPSLSSDILCMFHDKHNSR